MTMGAEGWLSLGEASVRLGVHPNTMRRWADAGRVPCYRTPGGHRRFRAAELRTALVAQATPAPSYPVATLVQQAIAHTRQCLAARPVRDEPWQGAFPDGAERQQMREMGHELLGLAVAAVRGQHKPARNLVEARRVGAWYGERCARHGVSLADTARSFCFFRTSVLQATSQGREGVAAEEQVCAHTELAAFLDEVMYACLASYEAACRRMHLPGSAA